MGIEVSDLGEILTKIFKIQKEDLHCEEFNPTLIDDFPRHSGYIVKPKNNQRLKLKLQENEKSGIFQLDSINLYSLEVWNEKRLPTLVFENFDFPNIYLSYDLNTTNKRYYYPIIFRNCSINSINSIISIENNKNLQPISFERCEIKNVQLNKSTLTSQLFFQESIILKCSFSNCVFCNYVYFNNSSFKDYIYFHECEFEKKVYFGDVYFNEAIFYWNTFKDEIDFRTCQFEKNARFSNNIFKNNAHFNNSSFKDYAYFHECEFQKNASFNNSIFKDCIYFHECEFQKNAHFNNSIFKDYADFGECKFEQGASFYGVSFEKVPNFSQAIFKGDLNLVNTNLNFDFEDLELRIEKEFEEYNKNKKDKNEESENKENKNKNEEDIKTLQNFANDFRDSFRIFKSALVANHNVLDALDFHRAELYCKEVELKAKWNEKHIKASNEIEMRNNARKFKECVDYLLLCFYRKLCEHHTDFLRVFNNLILLIALYVAFFCIGNFELLIENATDTTKSTIKIHSDFLNMIAEYMKPYQKQILCVYLITLVIVSLCTFLIFIKQMPTIKLIVGTSYKSFIRDIVNIIITAIFILFALAIVDGYAPKEQFRLYDMYLFCFFVVFYLWLVCIRTLFLRYIVICAAYILTFIGIGTSISLVNPLIGKLVDDSMKINNSSLSSITLAYTILMILVLFSLQKTARKNSIIPS